MTGHEILSRAASDAGLHVHGATAARPLSRFEPWLRDRLASGRAVPGERDDPGLRLDPSRYLPGARSVWTAALCDLSHPPGEPAPETARLARFTWGTDYHRVMEQRLGILVDRLTDEVGPFAHRIAVDTLPIMDRALALEAGMGWMGKNTCLINPRWGSWMVLGAVITDLPPPGPGRPDLPDIDPCRGCNRCVEACPTGALSPYRLDGNRCLSHINQSRQDPPGWAVPHLEVSIWGCDVCQEVCPWNGGVIPPSLPEFRPPSPARAYPDPVLLGSMTDRQFTSIYGDAQLAWRGPEVLRRNARLLLSWRSGGALGDH